MNDLYVTWDQYHALIEALAVRVAKSGWAYDTILCLARGGLRIGDVFSRIFRKPFAILTTSSYRGDAGTQQDELLIAEHYTAVVRDLGRRVLLIDDMTDSGKTLECVVAHLRRRYPDIAEIRSAVLWHKAHSAFCPDYVAQFLETSPWIHQPFEMYDRMPVEALLERAAQGEGHGA